MQVKLSQPIQEKYEKQYAVHHSIPPHWVSSNERLQLAAFLEWQVFTGTITLPDARRRYVNVYPESNRLNVPKTIYAWIDNEYTYRHDWNYAKGSVLNMIQPYEDSIREVTPICEL